MPTYRLTFDVIDVQLGRSSKIVYGVFSDYATAEAAANALLGDWDTATGAAFDNVWLAEELGFTGVQGTQSVFEVADATLETDGDDNRNFKLPAPIGGLFVGNTLDKTATEWTALMGHFTGADSWRFSRTEQYVSTVKGKRAYVNSGKTNLV